MRILAKNGYLLSRVFSHKFHFPDVSDHTKGEPNLPLLDKFWTLKSISEKLGLGCKSPVSRIHEKQNFSIERLLSDTLGFLGQTKEKQQICHQSASTDHAW